MPLLLLLYAYLHLLILFVLLRFSFSVFRSPFSVFSRATVSYSRHQNTILLRRITISQCTDVITSQYNDITLSLWHITTPLCHNIVIPQRDNLYKNIVFAQSRNITSQNHVKQIRTQNTRTNTHTNVHSQIIHAQI